MPTPNPFNMTPAQKAAFIAQEKAIAARAAKIKASKVALPDTSKMNSKQYDDYLKKFVIGKK